MGRAWGAVARNKTTLAIVVVAAATSVLLPTALSSLEHPDWDTTGNVEPVLGQGSGPIQDLISQEHDRRTVRITATARFAPGGGVQVTFAQWASLPPNDPLIPKIQDGEVQTDHDAFDAFLFGYLQTDVTATVATTLIDADYTPTGVHVSDTQTWTVPPGYRQLTLDWTAFPVNISDATDLATFHLDVRGGIITARSGASPTLQIHNAVTVVAAASDEDTHEIEVTLVSSAIAPSALVSDSGAFRSAILSGTWGMMVGLPALLLLYARRSGRLSNFLGVGLAVLGALSTPLAILSGLTAVSLMGLYLLVLPLLVAVLAVARRTPLDTQFAAWTGAVLALTFAAALATVPLLYSVTAPSAGFAPLALGALAVAMLTARLAPTRLARFAALLVPLSILHNSLDLVADNISGSNVRVQVLLWLLDAAWPAALFAATAAAVACAVVGIPVLSGPRRALPWIAIGLAALPVPRVLHAVDSSLTLLLYSPNPVTTVAAVVVTTGVGMLAYCGRTTETGVDFRTRYAAMAVLGVACAGYGILSDSWSGFTTLLTVAAVNVLMPRARRSRARLLARPDTAAHTTYIGRLLRLRTLAAAEQQFHRDAVAKIADETMSPAEYTTRSGELRRLSSSGTTFGAAELALGTLAGCRPWSSGVAGLAVGAAVSIPLTVETIVQTDAQAWDLAHTGSALALGLVILHIMRWSIYGFVYGYFYTWLRGSTAYAKAAWMAGCLLAPELAMAWPLLAAESRPFGLALVGAQLGAFFAVLATVWEIRQARRAWMTWGAVRNLRSIRALAAPSSAILLALVTATATALADSEIPRWVAPPSAPVTVQTPGPTQSPKPSNS